MIGSGLICNFVICYFHIMKRLYIIVFVMIIQLVSVGTYAQYLSEDFDNATTSAISAGWDVADNSPATLSTSFRWKGNPQGFSGACAYSYMYGSAALKARLKSPSFTLPAVKPTIVSFRMKGSPTESSCGHLNIYISTDGGTTYETNIVTSDVIATDDWKEYTFSLAGYSGLVKLVFEAVGSGTTVFRHIYLDDIVVRDAPTCHSPSDLYINGITGSSANLFWDLDTRFGVAPDLFSVSLKDAAGNLVYYNAAVTQQSISFTGLQNNTSYTAYVRSNCDIYHSKGFSDSVAIQFTTLPVAINPPFYENFNSLQSLSGGYYLCNAALNTSVSYSYGNTGKSVKLTTTPTNNAYIIFPLLNIAGNDIEMDFLIRRESAVSTTVGTVIFKAGYLTDPYDNAGTFVSFHQDSLTGGTYWRNFHFNSSLLTDTTSPVMPCIFVDAAYATSLYLDEVYIHEIPSCIRPENLTVTNISDTSALLSWNGSNATSFVVNATNATTSAVTSYQTSQNPFTVAGLSPNTSYTFTVRGICSATDSSLVSQPVTAKTYCSAATSTVMQEGAENTIGTAIPDCWTTGYIVNPAANTAAPFQTGTTKKIGRRGFSLQNRAVGTVSYMASQALNFDQAGKYSFRYKFNRLSGVSYAGEGLKVFVTPTPGDTANAVVVIPFINASIGNAPVETSSGWLEYEGVVNYQGIGYIMFVGYSKNGTTHYFDDLEVFLSPSCPKVNGITAGAATTNSFDLSWNPGYTESQWVVDYSLYQGATVVADTSVVVNTPLLTVQNLLSSTNYTVQGSVRALCGGNDTSVAVAFNYTVATQCTPLSSLPYTCSFEEDGSDPYPLPNCWSRLVDGSVYNYLPYNYPSASIAHSGTKSLYFYLNYSASSTIFPTYQVAVLPEVDTDLYPLNTLRMRFYARKYSATNSDVPVIVGVLSDPMDIASFVAVDTVTVTGASMQLFSVLLSGYSGNGSYVAILVNNEVATRTLYVDDVTLELIPSCLEIAGNTIVSDTTISSAKITLGDTTAYSAWSFAYAPAGTAVSDMTPRDTTGAVIVLNGLTPATQYDLYVRRNCGSEYSAWSEKITFSTAAIPIIVCTPPAALVSSNITANSATVGVAVASVSGYEIIVDSVLFSEDVVSANPLFRGVTATGSVVLNGLSPNTLYYYSARSICAVGDTSVWIAPDLFRTRCDAYPLPYSEGFEDIGATNCWSVMTGTSGASIERATAFQKSGLASLKSVNAAVVSPELDVDSLTHYMIKGWAYAIEDNLQIGIGVMADPNDIVSFEQLSSFRIPVANTWTEFTAFFSLLSDPDYEDYRYAKNIVLVNTGHTVYYDNLLVDSAPACPMPTEVAVTNIGAHSFDISFVNNAAGATQWIVYTNGVPNGVYTTNATITGLAASTSYVVEVASVCASGDTSSRASFGSIRTACDRISTPWSCGFEQSEGFVSTGSYEVNVLEDACWNTLNVNAGGADYPVYYATTVTNFVHSGSQGLFTNTNATAQKNLYLILPEFAEPANMLDVRFWYQNTSLTPYYSQLIFGYFTDATADTSFVAIDTLVMNYSWMKGEFLTNAAEYNVPANARLGFKIERNRYGGGLYLDDISVSLINNCSDPEAPVVSGITDSTVNVVIADTCASHALWEYVYGSVGFNPYDGTPVAVDTNCFILAGLNPETGYDLYLRAVCGTGDYSSYVKASFVTLCSPFSVTASNPFSDSFEALAVSEQLAGCYDVEGNYSAFYSMKGAARNDATHITAHTGDQCLNTNGSYAYLPDGQTAFRKFHLAAGTNYKASVWTRATTYSGNVASILFGSSRVVDSLYVVATLTLPACNYVTEGSVNTFAQCWQELSGYISVPVSGDYYIALHADRGTSANNDIQIFFDDFTVVETTDCYSSAVTVDTVTKDAVVAHHSDMNPANTYEYMVTSGADTVVAPALAVSNPFSVAGLTPSTTYTLSLRQVCGGGNVSGWSLAQFATLPDDYCYAPANLHTVGIVNRHHLAITWGGTSSAVAYQYMLHRGNLLVDSACSLSDTIVYDSLVDNTVYTFSVRTLCPADTSDWVTLTMDINTCPAIEPDSVVVDSVATDMFRIVVNGNNTGAGVLYLVASDAYFTDTVSFGIAAPGVDVFSVSGLAASTSYHVQLNSFCSVLDTSTAITFQIRTLCGNISSFPLTEGFETYIAYSSATTQLTDACWLVDATTASAGYFISSFASEIHSGSRSLRIYNGSAAGTVQTFALPKVDSLAGKQISMWYKNAPSAGSALLEVGYLADSSDALSFVTLATAPFSSAAFTEYSCRYPASLPAGARPAFRANGSNELYIDDVRLNNVVDAVPENDTICFGGSYTKFGFSCPSGSLAVGDTILVRLQRSSVIGVADSLITVNLHIRAEIITYNSDTICAGQSYVRGMWNLQNPTTDLYFRTFTSSTGCDSTVYLSLYVSPTRHTVLDTICEGDTYTFCGQVLSQPGSYVGYTINRFGCNDTITLHLCVLDSAEITNATICQGSYYTWEGQNYNQTGVYRKSSVGVRGCMLTKTLNLTVVNTDSTIVVSFCHGGQVQVVDTVITTPGNYLLVRHDQTLNCDFTYHIAATEDSVSTGADFDESCEGKPYYGFGIAGVILSADTTFTFNTRTVDGKCDSAVVVTIGFIPTVTGVVEEVTIPKDSSYIWHDQSYIASGTYRDTIPSLATGCDSVCILKLTVDQGSEVENPRVLEVCIVPNPVTAGQTSFVYVDAEVTEVEILNSFGQVVDSFVPDGYPIEVGGVSASGIYYVRLLLIDGSVAVEKLIVK